MLEQGVEAVQVFFGEMGGFDKKSAKRRPGLIVEAFNDAIKKFDNVVFPPYGIE